MMNHSGGFNGVNGTSRIILINSVFDHESESAIAERLGSEEAYGDAYALYADGEFRAARDAYSGLARAAGEKGGAIDPLLRFYLNRCEILLDRQARGDLKGWNGVYEFREK